MPYDEVLLLLQEEGVEPIDLGVEQAHEGSLGGPATGRGGASGDEADEPLEALVRQELVPPLREALLHLLLEPLAELHLLHLTGLGCVCVWEGTIGDESEELHAMQAGFSNKLGNI